MACLHNSSSSSPSSAPDHPTKCPPMSPRISFSNDFAESKFLQVMRTNLNNNPREDPPPPSDFEFSVTNNYNNTTTADELFFKGQFLPFKGTHKPMTLREELLVEEDDLQVSHSHRPPKSSSTRWKGLLGLNKSHIGSKRSDSKNSPPPPPTHAFDFSGNGE